MKDEMFYRYEYSFKILDDLRVTMEEYIDYYNKADVLILASRKLYDYLRVHGLKQKKVVIQHMWDHISQVNPYIIPKNKKVINFAGDPKKFDFVKDWSSENVKLNVYSEPLEGVNNPNITLPAGKMILF